MVVLQQQQMPAGPVAHNPLIGSLTQTSSEQSTEEFDPTAAVNAVSTSQQQQPTSNSVPLARDHGNVVATTRNRRTISGSGHAISQHTRDRLKSM